MTDVVSANVTSSCPSRLSSIQLYALYKSNLPDDLNTLCQYFEHMKGYDSSVGRVAQRILTRMEALADSLPIQQQSVAKSILQMTLQEPTYYGDIQLFF